MEQNGCKIREIMAQDFDALMQLYTHLHSNPIPEKCDKVAAVWQQILTDSAHHIIVAEIGGNIASSCVCVIIPNLTHDQRPYALVENVVTDAAYRKRGLASACLQFAKELAVRENCYKIMLMTGAKDQETLQFYEHAGYNRHDKTAFIQWL
ncbi:MAG: GNAT family N-acetyltransferase [Oscillospiraceae bacterium]|nr:GNAT family N-acetyltransferase [Oscillospiraceae bacterium]MBQ5340209.1 GNAT family N-acetyltransferase [Oscillospiraceae bacterium]